MNNIFVNFYNGDDGSWVGFANFSVREVFDMIVKDMLQRGYAAEITNEAGDVIQYSCKYFLTDRDGFAGLNGMSDEQ